MTAEKVVPQSSRLSRNHFEDEAETLPSSREQPSSPPADYRTAAPSFDISLIIPTRNEAENIPRALSVG